METVKIVKAKQTCYACPSQWDAWDDEGNYYYLRYRWGIGTVDQYPSADSETWMDAPVGFTAHFDNDDYLDGCISLEEFCEKAGIQLALSG